MDYTYEPKQIHAPNEANDYNTHVARNGDVSWERVAGKGNTNVWYYDQSEGEAKVIAEQEYKEGKSHIGYTEETPKGEPPIETTHIVYEAEVTKGNTDIYYWNSKGESTPIADKPYGEYNPEFHKDYIVYEAEVGPGNRDIYLYDTKTGTEVGIDVEDYNAYNPHMAGPYVVYEAEDASGDTNLYSYNINDKKITPIAETPNKEGKAEVWGNGNVVYQYETADKNYDIYYYDALTGESKALTSSPEQEVKPDIAGKYVSWQGWDGNDWEVYRYDTSTGKTDQLTNNELNDYNPHVSTEGHVVYQQKVNGKNIDLYAHTDTGTLALGSGPTSEINPDIYGDYVTWQVWDGKDYEAYWTELTQEA